MATDADPNLERRATLLFFTFADRKDQIIAFGVADYKPPLLNSMRPSLPCAQFWAEPVNTWVSVARSPARGMRMVRTRKYSRY